MRKNHWKSRWALVAGLMVAGCAAETPSDSSTWTPIADLTVPARWGDASAETRHIDFEGASLANLGSGWARPESGEGGQAFAWAVGDSAELTWTVFEPRDRKLIFRGWPFQYDGAAPQRIRVLFGADEVHVADFEMTPGLHEYAVEIPQRLWRQGANSLRIDSSRATAPADVSSSGDSRRLAAAWTDIRLADLPTSDAPHLPIVDEERIFLPWNSRLDVFLDIPEGGAIDAERVSFRGSGRLAIELSSETPQPGFRDSVTRGSVASTLSEPPELPILMEAGPGPHRLRLTALSSAPRDGGIVFLRPRLSIRDSMRHSGSPSSTEPKPTVPTLPIPDVLVLYVVDTLRADHLAPWASPFEDPPADGAAEWIAPTPNLDAFAAESVVFQRTTAQSPWTKASMASILTGLWPPEHGAINRDHRLSKEIPALPERLQSAGWRTEAVVTNPNVTDAFGFDRGFDHFEYLGEEADAYKVNRAVEDALARHAAEPTPDSPRRLFLYVHVLDPHSPYDPPSPWRERLAPDASPELARESLRRLNDLRMKRISQTPELLRHLHELYRAEIAAADDAFGEFLDLVAEPGKNEAAILFVSDHGEEFLEHGNLEHGRALHGESIWVPMALRWPGLAPARSERPVQHLDILPTLLTRLGIEPPQGLEGTDLLADPAVQMPGRLESGSGSQRAIFSHLHLDGLERASVLQNGFKAIVEFGDGCDPETGRRPERRWQLYDTSTDPGELHDLSGQRPVGLGFLRSQLRRKLSDCRAPSSGGDRDVEMDEETRRSLEALGYL